MSTRPLSSTDDSPPTRRAEALQALAATALSLALAIAVGARLLRGGGGDDGVVARAERSAEITTTAGDHVWPDAASPVGGLAERYREEQRTPAAGEAAGVPPRSGLAELYAEQEAAKRAVTTTLYIVGSEEQATQMRALGSMEHEMVLVAGTLEEQNRALSTIKLLDLETEMSRPPRRLELVDLRQR